MSVCVSERERECAHGCVDVHVWVREIMSVLDNQEKNSGWKKEDWMKQKIFVVVASNFTRWKMNLS